MGAPAYQQPLSADMDKAKELVDSKAAELDSKLIQPASDAFKKASTEYPLATLFCTTFAILSIFPILAFIGFAICAGSIILATTLVFLVGWLGLIIGSAAVILATVLSVTIGISLTVTGSAACAAIAYKLVLNVKAASSVRDGILLTMTEVKEYINNGKPADSQSKNQNGYRVSTLPMPDSKHVNGYPGSPIGHSRTTSVRSVKPEVDEKILSERNGAD